MALKDIPKQFDIDSEEDLRYAVAQYFCELGFETDELSFEDYFSIRLGHNSIRVNKEARRSTKDAGGRSDLLLSRNGEPIAIVEVKAPDHALTDDDAWQAISYARLLLKMAPFAILTNGGETRVYDPFAESLEYLDDPTLSKWYKNGEEIPTIADDLRYRTTQQLIGIDSQTLKAFCEQQVENAITDLKGLPDDGGIYIPDVYLARQDIVQHFNDWLLSELSCFAVVAESGYGKTNFMCASAERLLGDNFILFYQAGRLRTGGLVEAICNDFVWEFHRDRDIAYIISRFDDIAHRHNLELIIFLDALDEFPGDQVVLKNELLDFVSRLQGLSVRLCVSCKSFDWANFVIDRNQSYNSLAKAISPPEKLQNIDAHSVGVWFSAFSDDELDTVFPKYKTAFSLSGELQGNTRAECQSPLMLRLISEIYKDRAIDLPIEISSRDLFDKYWDRRLSLVQHRRLGEAILTELATLMITSEKRQIELVELRACLTWTDFVDKAYEDLVRLGFLRESIDDDQFRLVTFGFEKMRSYVFATKAQRWQRLPPPDAAKRILELLSNPLGFEAIEFYLTVIDRGETSLLTHIALLDLSSFVRIVSLDLNSSLAHNIPENQQHEVLRNRLVQYVEFYSEILGNYFAQLSERIVPYTKSRVGIWVHGSTYQLRARTSAFPDPVVELADEVWRGLHDGSLSSYVYAQLQPAGDIYWGMNDIGETLPQKIAWERLEKQIVRLLRNRMLNESTSPILLQERILDILFWQPNTWLDQRSKPHTLYWQLLGFEHPERVLNIPISDLREAVHDLILEFRSSYPAGVKLKDLDSYQKDCFARTRELLRLYYWLELLQPTQQHLQAPKLSVEEYFQYLREGSVEPAIAVMEKMVPDILSSYNTLIESNFANYAERFALFQAATSQIAIEVSWNPRGGFYTDYLTVSYIVLKEAELPQFTVYTCDKKDSVANLPLIPVEGVTAFGGNFGRTQVTLPIKGISPVKDCDATIYSTKFPDRLLALSQVYQLLSNELQYILGTSWSIWHDVEYGRTDNDFLDSWILRYYAQQNQND